VPITLRRHLTQYRADSETDAASLDEHSLVESLARSETVALERIIRVYQAPLTAYASRVLDDVDGADDTVADVFARLWDVRATLRPRSLRSYLFAVARNLCLDELRRRRSRSRIARLWRDTAPPAAPDPAYLLQSGERKTAIDVAIQQLPLRQREVFELAYLQHLSYHEVAEVMGTSYKTVGNQLTAALKQLRCTLQPLLDHSELTE
jgi:RNA polymerase sigma-70 factor (ECF subfamily)